MSCVIVLANSKSDNRNRPTTVQPRRPTETTKKHANQYRVLFCLDQIDRLDLRQFDAAFGAAARDDGAATPRAHAGAETEFAGARTFFGLPGAFHDGLFSDTARPNEFSMNATGADVFRFVCDFAS